MGIKWKKLVGFGLGATGLSSLAYFATSTRYDIIGFSFDEEEIKSFRQQEVKFLDASFSKAVYKSRLSFSFEEKDILDGDVFIIAFDGLINEENLVIKRILEILKGSEKDDITIIIRSLCEIGTTRKIRGFCEKELSNKRISLLYIPSFNDRGYSLREEKDPFRIVVGCSNEEEEERGLKLYSSLIAKGLPYYICTYEEAEMSLLASLSYYSLKTAFFHELAKDNKKWNIDIEKIVELLGSDPRIGRSFASPKNSFRPYENELSEIKNLPLVQQAFIDRKEEIEAILKRLEPLYGKKVVMVGLSSAMIHDEPLANSLFPILNKECDLACFDFSLLVEKNFSKKFPEAHIENNFYSACEGAEAILLLSSLEGVGEQELLKRMKGRIIIDWPISLDRRKFKYFEIHSPGKPVKYREIDEI